MADGAGTAAVIGGLVMIATAGIPVLFLAGQDKPEDKAARASGIEAGLKSEMGEAAFEEAMMEVVEDEPAVEAAGDDAAPKQRGSI